MVRFWFVNLPLSSHINPTINLVRELIQRGHHVTYVLAEEVHDQLEGTGAELVPYDHYDSEWSELRHYASSFERAYETAKRVGEENDFDCLVQEAFFVFGNKLANDLNLPRIRLFSTFAFNEDVLARILETGGAHFNLLKDSNPLYRLLTGYFDNVKGMMETEGFLDEITHSVPDLNITYTSREFQYLSDQFDEERFKFVGPPIDEDEEETADFAWAEMRRPIIYMAMGTMIDRFAKTLFENVFEAFAQLGVTVIASVGNLVDTFDEEKLPDNVLLYARVPQVDVLKHVDFFITHGGMNSVNEAIYTGVPMLVNPLINDQMVIAEQIDHLGIGKRLDLKEATPNEIRTHAMNTIASTKIEKRIKEEQQNMRELGGNKEAADLILEYIQELG